jgi:gas vesicle protein
MAKNGGNLLDGFLLGGLLGLAAGLLLAPAAGEKSRQLLKDKLQEANLTDLVDRFYLAFEEGKKEAEEYLEKNVKEVE